MQLEIINNQVNIILGEKSDDEHLKIKSEPTVSVRRYTVVTARDHGPSWSALQAFSASLLLCFASALATLFLFFSMHAEPFHPLIFSADRQSFQFNVTTSVCIIFYTNTQNIATCVALTLARKMGLCKNWSRREDPKCVQNW